MKMALIIYAAGCATVALRQGWHMFSKLDKYDWSYGRVWQSFTRSVILWPIRILFITPLLEPEETLRWGDWLPRHHRDIDNFRKSPPTCGALIRYRPKEPESCGDFVMKSPDMENECRQIKKELPHFFFGIMEKDLLAWLHQRNEALEAATEVPPILAENVDLSLVIDRLIRSGHALAWCGKCGEVFRAAQLTTKPDPPCPGINYERVFCPRHHQLLARAVAHVEPIPHHTRLRGK